MDPRFVESGSAWYVSPIAGELTAAVKTTPGKLFYLRVVSNAAGTVFVFVCDGAPGNNTIVIPPVKLLTGTEKEFVLPYPLQFKNTNISISSSTTGNNYAAGGANDIQVSALFK